MRRSKLPILEQLRRAASEARQLAARLSKMHGQCPELLGSETNSNNMEKAVRGCIDCAAALKLIDVAMSISVRRKEE